MSLLDEDAQKIIKRYTIFLRSLHKLKMDKSYIDFVILNINLALIRTHLGNERFIEFLEEITQSMKHTQNYDCFLKNKH